MSQLCFVGHDYLELLCLGVAGLIRKGGWGPRVIVALGAGEGNSNPVFSILPLGVLDV